MARLAYLGTPELAVPPLRALVGAGHDVALCVTRPDRRRGRGGQTTPSPVKAVAIELGIAVSHDMDDLVTLASNSPSSSLLAASSRPACSSSFRW